MSGESDPEKWAAYIATQKIADLEATNADDAMAEALRRWPNLSQFPDFAVSNLSPEQRAGINEAAERILRAAAGRRPR